MPKLVPQPDGKTVLVVGDIPNSIKKLFRARALFLTKEEFARTSLTIPDTISVVIQYGAESAELWGWFQSRRILEMRTTYSLTLTIALLETFTKPVPKISHL